MRSKGQIRWLEKAETKASGPFGYVLPLFRYNPIEKLKNNGILKDASIIVKAIVL